MSLDLDYMCLNSRKKNRRRTIPNSRRVDFTELRGGVGALANDVNVNVQESWDSFRDRFMAQQAQFIPSKQLWEVHEQVAPHLAETFNESLWTREVPREWWEPNVTPIFKKGETPIFKKGDRANPGNYRPISLKFIIVKIMEDVLVDKIVDFLERNNLLLDSQHGFWRHRSCLINLIEFFHVMFQEYDRNRAIDMLYLDFQKAFHKRLMSKYINGIDVGIVSPILLYAGDTKLAANFAAPNSVDILRLDLENVGEWSEKWLMPFILDKCKIMHTEHANQRADYSLSGHDITSTELEKYLYVLISSNLNSSKWCKEVGKKAQKLSGYIRRRLRYFNQELVLTFYKSLARPHIEYTVQFWSPNLRMDAHRLE
ncbi:uncharacterized protein LOC143026811 [Oratosquilla oratoria]|uniref:uncharacterized protein LOC143026811 n=1 Tax=Oratosquilla oratoria TaxID=337810 RepID=UPI003F75C3C5